MFWNSGESFLSIHPLDETSAESYRGWLSMVVQTVLDGVEAAKGCLNLSDMPGKV